MEKFQGWSNYETWNAALYINNDFGLYQTAKNCANYDEFLQALGLDYNAQTPDGVRWTDPAINREELNEDIFKD